MPANFSDCDSHCLNSSLARKHCVRLAIVLTLFSPSARAEWDIDGYVSIATDYVYRGLSLTDGKVNPSAGLSAQHDSGFFIGLWAASDDIAGLAGESQSLDAELEYSLGYAAPINDDWQLSVSYAWLEYQQNNQPVNHDYQEARATLNYQDRFSLFVAHADSTWNSDFSLTTVAFSSRHSLPAEWLGEIELGIADFSNPADVLYPYLRVSAGKALSKHWIGTIEYHYSGGEADNFFNSDRVGGRFVGRITYSF